MFKMPDSDQKLSSELQFSASNLRFYLDNFYRRRPGCACDEKNLCGRHAAVYNHLVESARFLALAVDMLDREE